MILGIRFHAIGLFLDTDLSYPPSLLDMRIISCGKLGLKSMNEDGMLAARYVIYFPLVVLGM